MIDAYRGVGGILHDLSVRYLSLVMMLLCCFSTSAQASEDTWRYLVQLGWDRGGETLYSGRYVNMNTGALGPSFSVNANEGLILDFGVELPLKVGNGIELATQLLAGWKYSTVQAQNGSLTLTSIPLTAIEQVTFRNGFSIGGGLVYQMRPNLHGSGVASGLRLDMNNSLGEIVQIGYSNAYGTVGLRYTVIRYQPKLYVGEIRGDSFGLFVSVRI